LNRSESRLASAAMTSLAASLVGAPANLLQASSPCPAPHLRGGLGSPPPQCTTFRCQARGSKRGGLTSATAALGTGRECDRWAYLRSGVECVRCNRSFQN